MSQFITMKSQAMTDHVNRQNVQRENPPVLHKADTQRDFKKINSPIFTGSMTSEDPKEFVDEVYKILVVMGLIDTKKAELASYQLMGGYGGHIY